MTFLLSSVDVQLARWEPKPFQDPASGIPSVRSSLLKRRRLFYSPSFLSTTSAAFAMPFLLLVYSLTQGNTGDASPIPSIQPRADVSCNDLNNCRTIWDIIWSCLSTILLCTWVTLHPNIAISRDKRGIGWLKESMMHPLRGFMKNKLPLFLCALVAPEYILSWAIRQYLIAGDIRRKVPGWTRTHGFFMIMGGYHLYRLPRAALSNPYPSEFNLPTEFAIVQPITPHSREEEVAEHPLEWYDLSVRALAYIAPSMSEIADKGKADVLAKVLALAQTLWFVVQCIARGVRQLPLTELEVVTLAYATVNLFISYFWWSKPKAVECPVRVYKTLKAGPVKTGQKQPWKSGALGLFERMYNYIGGLQDGNFSLREEIQVPMFWSGDPSGEIATRTVLGASIIGVVFGAIHFVAWHTEFPSHTELLLWRISCIAIVTTPLTVTISASIFEMSLEDKMWAQIISDIILATSPLTASLYLFARIATLVMAFATLRALPLGALETVNWTTFIPHL